MWCPQFHAVVQPILSQSSVRSGAAEVSGCMIRAATASVHFAMPALMLKRSLRSCEENSAVTMTRLILVMHSLALFVDSLKCETSLMARRSDPVTHLTAAQLHGVPVCWLAPHAALAVVSLSLRRSPSERQSSTSCEVCAIEWRKSQGTGSPPSRLIPSCLSLSQKTTS